MVPHSIPRITARRRPADVPRWATLERELLEECDAARRDFEARYCLADGSLRFGGRLGVPPDDRDGVDDFYEPFFNWPMLYVLGGADELLPASKLHWQGVTDQLTAAGMMRDGWENGYDWFHQGEAQLFLYALCLAAPDDANLRAHVERFAELYVDPARGNYDPAHRILRSPHTGALGAREGLQSGTPVFPWSRSFPVYGLPLDDVEGVTDFAQLLASEELAHRYGAAMGERMGRGDTAVNLASTSLVTTAALMGGPTRNRDWVLEYTEAWAERARDNGGLIPDNVGRSGLVGEYHSGRWYGGHYGWTWPHGWHSVSAGVTVGGLNATLLTGDPAHLDTARTAIDFLRGLGVDDIASRVDEPFRGVLGLKIDGDWDRVIRMVPYRHRDSGWFDYHELDIAAPLAVWLAGGEEADRDRLRAMRREAGYDWSAVHAFRGKDEGGHGEPWFAYLEGDNPDYPVEALELARRIVRERREAMEDDEPGTEITRIHHWQGVNPVVTEALLQLTCGAPQVLYNGGLLIARVRYFDAERRRPGLPVGVAALVSSIDGDDVTIELVNAGTEDASLIVQAGGFAEHRIRHAIGDDGTTEHPGGPYLEVALPAGAALSLRLALDLHAETPTLNLPWTERP